MSQSLYTAMSGISAATTSLQVISNNIANINTTAYKSSSVKFTDVFYQTVSSGSVATESTGGTNPVQVGVGTQVSAVTKNFSTGSWMATGNDTDLMIQGSGFFCVKGAGTSTYYTRDGSFSFDSGGNLVTSDGYKVFGTDSIMSLNTSGKTVQVPLTICADVKGTDSITLGNETLYELNNLSKNITSGDFKVTVTAGGLNYTGTITSLEGLETDSTVSELAALLETGLSFNDENGNRIRGIQANIVDGQVQIDTSNATVATYSGATLTGTYAVTAMEFKTDGLDNATNFISATGLSDKLSSNPESTCITSGDFTINITDSAGDLYTGTITLAIPATATAKEAADLINTELASFTATHGATTATVTNLTASINSAGNLIINATAGDVAVGATHTSVAGMGFADVASGSNFAQKTTVSSTGLTATTTVNDTYYATDTLDYTVNISELKSANESISATGETINADGSIQVTYEDGSVLSVQLDGDDYEFIYTTKDNVGISGPKCTVDPMLADEANFVIQMATITNTNGLISEGSNMYSAGPNSGEIIYTVGGKMGSGTLQSGGLEASNVDLSEELSNMILAQRAIESNSRVFTTTSDVMSTVVNMGR